jgi:hypothetical protein
MSIRFSIEVPVLPGFTDASKAKHAVCNGRATDVPDHHLVEMSSRILALSHYVHTFQLSSSVCGASVLQ